MPINDPGGLVLPLSGVSFLQTSFPQFHVSGLRLSEFLAVATLAGPCWKLKSTHLKSFGSLQFQCKLREENQMPQREGTSGGSSSAPLSFWNRF